MDDEPTDAGIARERFARFGRLPERVRPDATVETVAAAPPPGRPEAAGTEDQRQVMLAGG